MGGRVVGHKETVLELSVFNRPENQWYHIARYFRYALHSTKGWRKAGTNKMVTKIHEKHAITRMRVTEKFEKSN
jgi:hypothetical protein